ncbi:SIN1-domain-containing protein [Gigaspora margarita]|uniref:SIN1-domain-containing protein n=1 Tax=Gigaspora margarita TaxID=4874 RepID=A0A8H4B110_GIGMA|nr:SIN1-domain-containing protein [Gigaspora margarita]
MITCHSPSISMPGTDYFSSKSVMSSAAVSPISTNGRLKTMTSSNGSRDVMTHGKSSINNTENGDSDDDIELDENAKQPSFAKLRLPKQSEPPPVFVISPSKPPTRRSRNLVNSYSPEDALKTSPDIILEMSSNEQTPQLSPTTSAESYRVFNDRRDSETSLLTAELTEITSSPPSRPALTALEEKELFPDPPKAGSKSKPFSALTALIAEKKNKLDNPFAEYYSFFAGKGDLNPITLKIYFSFSREPLVIIVKRDAIVEEVIGYTLYQYWDEKREPVLEKKLCNVYHWNMRMVEDDGEIDEDFPALERTQKIAKFSFDQFALCEATPAQVKQNEAASNKLRASTYKDIESTPIKTNGTTVAASEHSSTMDAKTPKGVDFSNQIFLRVRLTLDPREAVAHTTTVNVQADTPFQNVLETVCRKRKLDSNKYTLKIADTDKYINMDNTVENVGSAKELALVEKPANGTSTASDVTPPSPTTTKDKCLSRRRTLNEPPQPLYFSSNEFMSVYKKYTVNRKIPMFVGRHERVLAIDGDYIHIMPSETRTMFESVKTSSYHITSVMSCKVNKKAPANFKLVIYRDSGTKTYDFEAESNKLASEISQKVNFLQKLNKGEQSKARQFSKH